MIEICGDGDRHVCAGRRMKAAMARLARSNIAIGPGNADSVQRTHGPARGAPAAHVARVAASGHRERAPQA
jgi:hypothetical protein